MPLRVQFHCDRYYGEVHAGIVDYAHTAQWALYDGSCYTGAISYRYTEPCDGMLAIVTDHELAGWLQQQTCPVVKLLCSQFLTGYPAVEPDSENIGVKGAEHFISIHARNCIFYRAWFTKETEAMWRGFRATLKEKGCQATLFDFSEGREDVDPIKTTREERWSWLTEKLRQLSLPIAVMAEDDRFVYDVVEAVRRLGWRIPADIAVLGADNRELILKKIPIPISSVESNLHRIGWEGAALLDRLMRGQKTPAQPVRVAPGDVRTRRSTATFMCDAVAVNEAIIYLRHHFQEAVRLEDVAKAAGVSERTLQALFKEHVGCTVSDELSRARLDHAARLLRETHLKLESVAHESGLRNAKYLCEVFRSAFNTTPATYREQSRLQAN